MDTDEPGVRADISIEEIRRRQAQGHIASGSASGPQPSPRGPTSPLSAGQTRLWVVSQMGEAHGAYNIPLALRIRGELNPAALLNALRSVVAGHEILRTRIVEIGDEPRQVVDSPDIFHVSQLDLTETPEEGRDALLVQIAHDEAGHRFNLSSELPVRALLVKAGDSDSALFLTLHHIAADGWSLGLIWEELVGRYEAACRGDAAAPSARPLQYADYAIWQADSLAEGKLDAQRNFWRSALEGAPPHLELPTDRPRPPTPSFRGRNAYFTLDPDTVKGFAKVARNEGATLYMALVAAVQTVLSRWSGQDDIVIGMPVAGRDHPSLEKLVGYFANTVALRTRLNGNPTVREALRRVRASALDAFSHQNLPFERVVADLQSGRDLSRHPLFQTMVVMHDLPDYRLADLAVSWIGHQHAASKFDLSFWFSESSEGLAGVLEYSTDLFDAETVERLIDHLRAVIAQSAAAPETRLLDLDILGAEQAQVLHRWNDMHRPSRRDRCIHHLFVEQAARTPDAIALIARGLSITYADLEQRTASLATELQQRGVGPETLVGIALGRDATLVEALLGVLRAGGAYVPLDPAYPPERLTFMMQDAGVGLLITDAVTRARLPSTTCTLIDLAELSALPAMASVDLSDLVGPDNLACVLYTSGSTGIPKGVALTHSATGLADWAGRVYSPEELQSVVASTSINFDLSAFEIFVPLMLGGTVILADSGVDLPPEASGATLLNTVPSVAAELLASGAFPPGVKTVNLAGEPLTRQLVDQLCALTGVMRVVNLYGPSEYTTYATMRTVEKHDDPPPIGRPLDNARVYLLDAGLNLTPMHVAGEIYIAGEGLARGYLNRPGLTAERFVPDPFGPPGSRMYRTGDRARHRGDGELIFLGRVDHQIKLRGFRIELGEVEAALCALPGVAAGAVAVRGEDARRRLVAFVQPQSGVDLDPADLRSMLRLKLPAYMTPSVWTILPVLPLNPNGKMDRAALAVIDLAEEPVSGHLPATELEALVAETWAEVLGVDGVGRDQDFFDLGGHSLLAVRVVSLLRRRHQLEASVLDLFSDPTPAGFAGRLSTAGAASVLPKAARDGVLPLSSGQRRLWFLSKVQGAGSAYHLPLSLDLRGALDRGALQVALDDLVERHEALRSRVVTLAGEPVLKIDPPRGFSLSIVPGMTGETDLADLQRREGSAAFDLETGPLARACLVAVSEDHHVLLVTLHHIIADGWSLSNILRDLGRLYGAALGRSAPPEALSHQHLDYVAWRALTATEALRKRDLDFWRATLADAPAVISLPTDRPRPAHQDFTGGHLQFRLDGGLTERLRALAQANGVTLYTTVMAGLALTLSRLARQKDVVLGTADASRTRPEFEPAVGLFADTLALRFRLDHDETVRALLRRTRSIVLDARRHQTAPFEDIVEALGGHRSLAHTPVFQVMVGWESGDDDGPEFPDLRVSRRGSDVALAKFDLTFGFVDRPGGVVATAEYAAALFDPGTVSVVVETLRHMLEQMALSPGERIAALCLMTPQDRDVLVDQWRPRTAYPAERDIPAGMAFHVRTRPDAIAVSDGRSSLTYAELEVRSNRLAHHLRRRGAAADRLVGICLDRSTDMVVAALAILKAGAAYLPLDPTYPPERLSLMLGDAAPVVVLASEETRPVLVAAGSRGREAVSIIDLAADAQDWSGLPETPPDIEIDPDNLAYLIYTSGSTGRPKGVMVSHRNVTRLMAASREIYAFDANDVWGQVHSFSFDFSVWEIWGALLTGGRIEIVPQTVVRDPAALYCRIVQVGITILSQTPTAFGMLVRAQTDQPEQHALRYVVFGGEALDTAALAPWFADPRNAGVDLINMYGITETTVHVTQCRLSDQDVGDVSPIGWPLTDLGVYVLDEMLEPCPSGVVGELYVSGAGLARGYYARGGLTAERFVPDPFSPPGTRMYRTGDLAKWSPRSGLQYAGRCDHQIKIRGHRIETGEIESQLLNHPGVDAAAVVFRPLEGVGGRLVAFVATGAAVSQDALCAFDNGLNVRSVNRHEARATFTEIFEDEVYRRHGIVIDEQACVFDVGANIGLFSIFVKGVAPDAVVHAFEPAAETSAVLRANLSAYGLDVVAHAMALSDRDGESDFHHYPGMSVNSGLYADAEADFALTRQVVAARTDGRDEGLGELMSTRFAMEIERCPTRRLSTMIAELGVDRIDLLKIDVEKSELDVLKGIDAPHWAMIRQVVIEVHDTGGRLARIWSMLEGQGFEVVAEQSDGLSGTVLHNLYARRPEIASVKPAQPWSLNAMPVIPPDVSSSAFRRRLSQHLPDFMIPGAFVCLAHLPMTANGKLDRSRLPSSSAADGDPRETPVRKGMEEAVADIWRDVLGTNVVGRYDSFFELGGHSLAAVRVVALLSERLGHTVSLRNLFAHPILADFAASIVPHAVNGTAATEMSPPPSQAPLTSGQQRMWFLEALGLTGSAYNLPLLLELEGDLHLDVLELALAEIVRRHEALRIRFGDTDGEPQQTVDPAYAVRLEMEDFAHLDAVARSRAAAAWATERTRTRFDLRQGQLVRFCLVRLGDRQHRLMIVMHHIVADGWSVSMLLDELVALYRAGGRADRSDLPSAPSYLDYARLEAKALHEGQYDTLLEHWRAALQDAPPLLALPTDRRRPAEPSFQGRLASFRLDADLSDRLRGLARDLDVTLFSVILALFSAVLGRWSGQSDVVVGTMVANRDRPETDRLFGLLANSLPLRIDLSGAIGFETLVKRASRVAFEAMSHQNLPFERLVQAIQPERDLSRQPIFQVMLLMQQQLGITHRRGGGLDIAPLPIGDDTSSKVDLTLAIDDGESLGGTIEYATDLFDHETMLRFISHITTLARGVVADPSAVVAEMPLISAAEQRRLLTEFNDNRRELPVTEGLQGPFEHWAALYPDDIALVDSDFSRRVRYADLDRWSNRLAHAVRDAGAGPEAVVGMCIPRSVEQVVAFIAVLKSGAAYLPLDQSNPDARLAYMLEDSGAQIVLADDEGWRRLRALPLSKSPKRVDHTGSALDRFPETRPEHGLAPANLAYVLYTSGSTGQPKGVAGEHGPMLNRLLGQPFIAPIAQGEVALQRSSVGFGAAVMETLGPLSFGGSLVVTPEPVGKNLEALASLIEAHAVTRSYLQPSVARAMTLVDRVDEKLKSIGTFTCSGEILDRALVLELAGISAADVINIYGATELSMEAISGRSDTERDPSPIGRPMPNVRAYVLDAALNPAPIGVVGDLFVGGDGLARGYRNKPGLTAQAFVPDPFATGKRLYRTGDLARWTARGDLEFFGRRDHQIKIRGYRIELGEIETALLACEGVRQAGAVVRSQGENHMVISAYVAPQAGHDLDPTRLASALAEWLPDYMLPSNITVLEAMPMTVSGKVDRKALPQPASRARSAVAESDETGAAVARVWCELLGLENIGADDNFFDVGGDSLLLLKLQKRLRAEFGRDIRVAELFKHCTVSAQGRLLALGAVPPETMQRRDLGSAMAARQRMARMRNGPVQK